jgi:Ca2+-binding RTX toxin-like protein
LPARTVAAAFAAAALAAVAAPAAHATTVSAGAGGTLVVTAAPGERNSLGLQADAAESGRLVVYEGGNATLSGPAGVCEPLGDYALLCDWTPAAGVSVDLGDGDDRGYVSEDLPANARFMLAGGPGDDRLQASLDGQPTTLDGGGPGKDELAGGPGADTLLGGDGDDKLEGKGGPDTLLGERDSVSCGAGADSVRADAIDVVAPDCETVAIVVAGAGGGAGGGPAPAGGPASLTASIAQARLAHALAHGLTVRVGAPAAGRIAASGKPAAGGRSRRRAA